MKSVIIIFACFLMVICTPSFYDFIDETLTDNVTQSFYAVSTPAFQYSANVTISKSLYNNNIANVVVTSNITSDSPTAYTYNSVSKTLEISGLADNITRVLLVDFLYDTENLDASFMIFFTTLRWLWILIVLGLIGGSIYAFFD